MSKYEIWITSKDGKKRLFKSYPHKLQAVIWCFLNNFVSSGRGCYFLDENIDSYYMNVGEIFLLQKICKEIGINIEQYNPYEAEEDDNKYNYCGAAGAIGIKDGNNE